MEIFPELLLIYFDSMRPCFSRYSAPLFEGYAFGILLCNGRKCMKRIAGLCWFVDRHLNSFERFLADHQWSSSELTKCWYRLLIKRLRNLAPCGRAFSPQHIPLFRGYNWDSQVQA
ncbi:hypothetical protein GMJAKD_09570 [Candidatus Electrothrix aarhusensis]